MTPTLSLAFSGFLKGFYECRHKKQAIALSPLYNLIGAFVWGDVFIFGFFWSLVCLAVLLFNSWQLFLIVLGAFWVVRSLGEMIYWLNQQFSDKARNPPETLWLSKFFPGDSVWFGMQIFWQCILVISAVFLILLL